MNVVCSRAHSLCLWKPTSLTRPSIPEQSYIMATAIAFTNLKGGVGKTTLAVNFAAYCGKQGKRTLLIDLDPQTNATFWCISPDQWKDHAAKKGTVADLLEARNNSSADNKKKGPKDVILRDVFENVDLVPSHLELFNVDLDMASVTARELKLRRAIASVTEAYDVIICDCPPNLTIPTQNALALCTKYVIPVSPDFLSSIGVALLKGRIDQFSDDIEHPLELAGIVISRVGRPSKYREVTVETLRQTFENEVLEVELTERSAVSQSAENHNSVFECGDTAAVNEFTRMSQELYIRIGL